MTEPRTRAREIEEVFPGLLHWCVQDDRIDSRSDAYAIVDRDRSVLIDPLPLVDERIADLRSVTAICLTIQSHQRAAWRLRRLFDVPVWAPRGAVGLEDEPDGWYENGHHLPGGLRAVHAPGPAHASYVLVRERPAGGGVLFLGDLLIRKDDGRFGFVDSEYMDEPALARKSVRALLDQQLETLCPGHGAPLLVRGRAALREALEREPRR